MVIALRERNGVCRGWRITSEENESRCTVHVSNVRWQLSRVGALLYTRTSCDVSVCPMRLWTMLML